MPDSAQGSFSGSGRSSAGCNSSTVPPPYDTTTYLRDYRAFSIVCASLSYRLSGPHWSSRLIRVYPTLPIMQGGGVGSTGLFSVPYVCRRSVRRWTRPSSGVGKRVTIRKGWLSCSLAGHRRLKVPSVVTIDLLELLENLCRLYSVSNRSYWLREFHFEARMRKNQKLLAEWQNVELFNTRTSERPSYDCIFPDW